MIYYSTYLNLTWRLKLPSNYEGPADVGAIFHSLSLGDGLRSPVRRADRCALEPTTQHASLG